MPQCSATTAAGTQCKLAPQPNTTLCKRHHAQEIRHQSRVVYGMIVTHLDESVRRGRPEIAETRRMVIEARTQFRITEEHAEELRRYIRFIELRYDPQLRAAARLERFADDTQNVHTTEISQQTNRGCDILLSLSEASTGYTMVEIESAFDWLYPDDKWKSKVRVLNDMNRWYNQPSIRKVDDYFYRRVLNGLWAYISETEITMRRELLFRLAQESSDAHGQCAEGHITRLVNVLVGFDERFEPPINTKEVLQHKMSSIASRDDDLWDKIGSTFLVMKELKVSKEEQKAWYEAL